MSESVSNNDRTEDTTECCICFSEVNLCEVIKLSNVSPDKDITSYKCCTVECCKKTYHISCLNEWFKTKPSCPMCREKIYVNRKIFPEYRVNNYNWYWPYRHYQLTGRVFRETRDLPLAEITRTNGGELISSMEGPQPLDIRSLDSNFDGDELIMNEQFQTIEVSRNQILQSWETSFETFRSQTFSSQIGGIVYPPIMYGSSIEIYGVSTINNSLRWRNISFSVDYERKIFDFFNLERYMIDVLAEFPEYRNEMLLNISSICDQKDEIVRGLYFHSISRDNIFDLCRQLEEKIQLLKNNVTSKFYIRDHFEWTEIIMRSSNPLHVIRRSYRNRHYDIESVSLQFLSVDLPYYNTEIINFIRFPNIIISNLRKYLESSIKKIRKGKKSSVLFLGLIQPFLSNFTTQNNKFKKNSKTKVIYTL